MKRSVKRSIFIQIILFSMNGIYTLFKDRKQEADFRHGAYLSRDGNRVESSGRYTLFDENKIREKYCLRVAPRGVKGILLIIKNEHPYSGSDRYH